MERKSKGIWIPIELWESNELTMQEKLMLVEIDSLDNDHGCFASNKHFAEWFGLSTGRCSQIIKGLESKGYISIEYIREGKEIKKRIIKSNYKYQKVPVKETKEPIKDIKYPIKNTKGGCLENDDTPIKKTKDPYLENDEGNNTKSINTKDINTRDIEREKKETTNSVIKDFAKGDLEIEEALLEFKEMREANKNKLTVRSMKLNLNQLEKLSKSKDEMINIINQSIMKCWKGFFEIKAKPGIMNSGNNQSKTKFHNFKQLSDDYEEDYLESLAKKKRQDLMAKIIK